MSGEKEFQVIISDQVKADAEKNPELAKALKEFAAMARQAMHGVETGKYESFDEAMEVLTGHRPNEVDVDEIPKAAEEATFSGEKPMRGGTMFIGEFNFVKDKEKKQ